MTKKTVTNDYNINIRIQQKNNYGAISGNICAFHVRNLFTDGIKGLSEICSQA